MRAPDQSQAVWVEPGKGRERLVYGRDAVGHVRCSDFSQEELNTALAGADRTPVVDEENPKTYTTGYWNRYMNILQKC